MISVRSLLRGNMANMALARGVDGVSRPFGSTIRRIATAQRPHSRELAAIVGGSSIMVTRLQAHGISSAKIGLRFASTQPSSASDSAKTEPKAAAPAASNDAKVIGKPQGDTDKQLVKLTDDHAVTKVEEKKSEKLTIWQKVKKEAKHYWDGTKLLGYEMRVSFKLALKMASGQQLTRREDRQLRRTVQDMIRLVPFSMFVLVPFAELLLPIALRLFPNLLPSTYESAKSKEGKRKKLTSTRSATSQYLQSTISKAKMIPANCTPEQSQDFREFFRQARSGEKPDRELVLRVASLFKDDMLLDNLSRTQLAAVAQYMALQPYGTSMVLRYLIRHRMRQVKADDLVIDREGIESLNSSELQQAVMARGFKVTGVSTGRLREDLANWLELRLRDKVPSTLLVLSSAYSYDAHDLDSFYDGISAVMAALPMEVYHEAELEVNSESATNEQRLEFLKEQEEMIKDENQEEEESGHVIKINDNINVDDEAEHTQTEAEAKEIAEGESKVVAETEAAEQKVEAEAKTEESQATETESKPKTKEPEQPRA